MQGMVPAPPYTAKIGGGSRSLLCLRPASMMLLLALWLCTLAQQGYSQCLDSAAGTLFSNPVASMGTGLRPRGVAVDSTRQRIYALEEGANLLKAMDLNGGQVWTRSVARPWNVAVDSTTGRIFVSQYLARAVLVFDTNGNQVLSIGKAKNFGEEGSFNGPAGLAITGSTLIVTDPDNNRFQTFTTAGVFQGIFGKKGFEGGAFGGSRPGPYGVAIHDSSRQIYFADPALNRVSRWAFSGSTPVFQAHFGSAGREPGQLWSPFSVAVNQGNGDVYVSSTNTFRVEVFSGCGNFRGTIGSTDSKAISRCDATPAGQTLFNSNSKPSPDQYSQFNFGRVTVGLRFTVKAAGFLTAVRFIKPSGDVNQHTMILWDATTRAVLYTEAVQVDGCRGGSWVSMALTSPVSLTTGKTYTISLDNFDQYAATSNGFGSAATTGSISIVSSSAGVTGASTGVIPTTASSTNYWVDIEFQTIAPSGGGPAFGYSYGSAFAVPSNDLFYLADATTNTIKTYSFTTGAAMPGPAPVIGTTPTQPTGGTSGAVTCGTFPATGFQTIFTAADTPATTTNTDGVPLVLGHRFTTTVAGDITAIRYFKAGSEGGTGHFGMIYNTATGVLVASTVVVTDTSCAGPRWVSIPLSTPFRTTAGVEYTVALDHLLFYAKTDAYLGSAKVRGDLRLSAGGAVYSTDSGIIPTSVANGGTASYWIDVEFSRPGVAVAPSPATTTSPPTGTSTTLQCGTFPGTGYQTFFTSAEAPPTVATTDNMKLVLGTRFRTSIDGDITAIRYFKAPGEAGTGHTGKIYNSLTGVMLASTITSTDSSCTGPKWVSVPLTAPFRTTAGVEYTVAIDSVLRYAKTDSYLTSTKVIGDLTLLGGGAVYGATLGVIPRSIAGGGTGNYWVDVEFTRSSTAVTSPPPTPAPVTPVPAPGGAQTTSCGGFPGAGYQTFFTADEVPASTSNTENTKLVLGVRFSTAVAGDITAVRYFKGMNEGSTGHTGRIYNSATGVLVASTTQADTACTGTGWVSIPLTTPFRTTAGLEYTVAIDSVTFYAKTDGYLGAAKASGDLRLVGLGGVYGTTSATIPRNVATDGSSNYWVDVEFARPGTAVTTPPTTPATPPTTPVPGPPPATPAPGPAGAVSCGTFPGTGTQTFFASSEAPATVGNTDNMKLVLGVRFTTAVAGDIRAVRYYKSTNEGGTGHAGKIYNSATGALVATTASVSDTSCPGPRWVSIPLTTAFRTTAGVEYTVAIDSVSSYAKTEGYLTADKISGDLRLIGGGFVYGTAAGSIPRNVATDGSSNYWVDVEFVKSGTAVTTPPTTPATPPTTPVPAPPPATPAPAPAGAVSCGTFPGTGLQTFFASSEAPATVGNTDNMKLVLGVRFTTAVAGDIRAVRYFKSTNEGGTGHAGKIYNSATGALVATTASVSDTSCPGPRWVSIPLTTAFRTTAGVEYTVAIDSVSSYAKTEGYLTADKISGDLRLIGGGFVYGTTSGSIPRSVAIDGTSNYWVDVEFARSGTAVTTPPTVPVTSVPAPPPAVPVPAPGPAGAVSCGTFPGTGVQTVFSEADVPATPDATDGMPLVLGLRFTTAAAGSITAVRFFKGAGEDGTSHSVRIYQTTTGAQKAVATFTDTSCPGPSWVSVPLATPFRTTARTDYTVAIDSVMIYAKTEDYLTAAKFRGDLTLVKAGAVYGTDSGIMPKSVALGGTVNYWIDGDGNASNYM